MTIERTALPGVGIRHTATTTAGQRLGIVSHVNGRREIVLYDPDDPDRAACTVVLEPDEARHVADLLSATITMDRVTDLEQRIDGITAARIRLPLGSAYDGRTVADAQTGTGASVVAVVRDEQVHPAPDPAFVLRHNDVVVAVGDNDGVAALTDILGTEHTTGG